jgi:hypothetical protein
MDCSAFVFIWRRGRGVATVFHEAEEIALAINKKEITVYELTS